MKRLIFFSLLILTMSATVSAEDIFRDTVAPILQQRCLHCHNATETKGDFSLQNKAGAFADGFIEPGDAAASHLVELITPKNGKAEMPKEGKPLTSKQIAAITRWIEAGAAWPNDFELSPPRVADYSWWSYQPVISPDVPALKDPWVKTPIDAFILRTLKHNGLSPSAPADRRTLIRRVTYDLTGLPPTPAEVEAFMNDQNANAWETVVDRLLSSKQYGERWARHWLDVAKYADTCGYDKDKLRPNAWPYRDYVIDSLNADKPYSRFVQEQIAGDVLFPNEPESIVALGFIAAGPWDFIGHVEVPESKIDGKVARNLDRDDMVAGAMNTFCSVTVQCARCHNHKFDPITQKDYYGLQAIFAGVDRAERPYEFDPKLHAKRIALAQQVKDLQAQQKALQAERTKAGGDTLANLETEIAALKAKQTVKKEPQFGYHSGIATNQTETKWVEVDLGKALPIDRIVLQPCHDEFANIGAGFGFPVRFQIEVAEVAGRWSRVLNHTDKDFANPGLQAVEAKVAKGPVRFVRVTATKLAPRFNDFNFAIAELLALNAEGKNVAIGAAVNAHDSIEAPVRWAKKNLTDGLWPLLLSENAEELLEAAVKKRSDLLAKIETTDWRKRQSANEQALTKASKELAAIPQGSMVYAAATHFTPQGNFKPTGGKLRPIHVLHRGDVQQPGEAAVPGVIPFLANEKITFPPDSSEAERRKSLALWLTRKEHPLVWRSIVNRVWQYHFGRGIVATPNDFGRMGAKPTHAELLDWLAVEFRDNGQSPKKLHRLIVTSSVYQQSSTFNKAHAAVDKSNRFLWRFSRRRLQAEEIRDSILQVSGAMNPKMGGPGFYLFELEKTAHSPHYEYHKFDHSNMKSHRRSIYRFIVRSQPDPFMTTLDCADSSQSTPRRNETLTSLQALAMLNNDFNLEMARRFTKRLEKHSDSLPQQVEIAVSLTLQRPPTDAEKTAMTVYAEKHGLPNLCRLLFNLSEFVYVE